MIYCKFKNKFDYLLALVIIILCFPLFIITALLIKWEDPSGPVVFRQKRLGKNKKIFTIFKFRSMRVETHQDGVELSDGERMLNVGRFIRKTSLDELPQLMNIIKGDMSFIGPRPLPVDYLPYYTDEEMKRHDIKPGISGWAQVNGRNNLTWEKKFELDVYYSQHITLLLDIKILLMTVKKVIQGSDVAEYIYDPSEELTEYRPVNPTFISQQATSDRQ